jgi:serine/threonine protein kinase
MEDREGPDIDERVRIERLVGDLLGTDAARCGLAHTELLAMGGFSRPEIREALQRGAGDGRIARLLPGPRRAIGGWELGACVGRGGFGFVYIAHEASGSDASERCLKLANRQRSGARAITRLTASLAGITSAGVAEDQVCADGVVAEEGGLRCRSVSAEDAATVLQAEFAWLQQVDSDLFPETIAAGIHDDVSYYVMEHVRARDLRRHLRDGSATTLDARRLFRRLARELAALHDRQDGFFHGDLKPENILVTPTRLRLIDPAYRGEPGAPLRATMSVPYNPLGLTGMAADTGALAITLLELLTDVNPYRTLAEPLTVRAARDLASVALESSLTTPLIGTLAGWVMDPPTYVEFAAALER